MGSVSTDNTTPPAGGPAYRRSATVQDEIAALIHRAKKESMSTWRTSRTRSGPGRDHGPATAVRCIEASSRSGEMSLKNMLTI